MWSRCCCPQRPWLIHSDESSELLGLELAALLSSPLLRQSLSMTEQIWLQTGGCEAYFLICFFFFFSPWVVPLSLTHGVQPRRPLTSKVLRSSCRRHPDSLKHVFCNAVLSLLLLQAAALPQPLLPLPKGRVSATPAPFWHIPTPGGAAIIPPFTLGGATSVPTPPRPCP